MTLVGLPRQALKGEKTSPFLPQNAVNRACALPTSSILVFQKLELDPLVLSSIDANTEPRKSQNLLRLVCAGP